MSTEDTPSTLSAAPVTDAVPDAVAMEEVVPEGAVQADVAREAATPEDAAPEDAAPPADSRDKPASPVREEHVALSLGKKAGKHRIRMLRFGTPGARPKAVLQAGLHADELPGMLVLTHLASLLEEEAGRGRITGEIVLIPSANPIGLAQRTSEMLVGRNDLKTGKNFNRDFPDLAALTTKALKGKLKDDADANVAKVRGAFAKALDAVEPEDKVAELQLVLLREAADADVVLDLHADNEAQLHIYTLPQLWDRALPLAAELDARAVLVCEDSGGSSFDEACSTPWLRLAATWPDAAIPPACLSATVELRSNNDVDDRFASRDARALLRFLMRAGAVEDASGAMPRLLCEPTPLTAVQQLKAPVEGLVVYQCRLGDTVRTGDTVAEIVPLSGPRVPVIAETDGPLFARHNQPWAWEGKIIGKIAGKTPLPDRVGNLLSP